MFLVDDLADGSATGAWRDTIRGLQHCSPLDVNFEG
jgi:hypothetical protein